MTKKKQIILIEEDNELSIVNDIINFLLGVILVIGIFYTVKDDDKQYSLILFCSPFFIFYLKELFVKPLILKRVGKITFQEMTINIVLKREEVNLELDDIENIKVFYLNHNHWKGTRILTLHIEPNNTIEINTKSGNYKLNFLCRSIEEKKMIKREVYNLHHKGFKVVYLEGVKAVMKKRSNKFKKVDY